jgi:hypothetical protein
MLRKELSDLLAWQLPKLVIFVFFFGANQRQLKVASICSQA